LSLFDRELQPNCLGHSNEGGKPRISANRQGAVQALALDAGGFGYLGEAASSFCDAAQGNQKHARLVVILQRGAEVFSSKLRCWRTTVRFLTLLAHGGEALDRSAFSQLAAEDAGQASGGTWKVVGLPGREK